MLKIRLLDKFFAGLDIAELEYLLESDMIVSKLKGTDTSSTFLSSLISDNIRQQTEIEALKYHISIIDNNLKILAKLVLKPYDFGSQDQSQLLKNTMGIY